jgi:hypothetical protein
MRATLSNANQGKSRSPLWLLTTFAVGKIDPSAGTKDRLCVVPSLGLNPPCEHCAKSRLNKHVATVLRNSPRYQDIDLPQDDNERTC